MAKWTKGPLSRGSPPSGKQTKIHFADHAADERRLMQDAETRLYAPQYHPPPNNYNSYYLGIRSVSVSVMIF